MEEGRWATRVLDEIGSARAAIAANYLALWRRATHASMDDDGEPPDYVADDKEATRPPPRPDPPKPETQ